MTSQNNDSGVDVVGGNDGDSDGDIVVDENPLPGERDIRNPRRLFVRLYRW